MRGHGWGEFDQRAFQDIGEHQVEGRGFSQTRMPETGGLQAFDAVRQAVDLRIGPRHINRHFVDVRRDDRIRIDPRGGHRQHGRAAADICHVQRDEALIHQPVQRPQAAQRCAMVSGAKGHRRFDQQGNPARRHLVGVVAAVNEEPPGFHRRQLAAHLGDPVDLWQFRQGKGLRIERHGQQGQGNLVGGFQKIAAHFPQARSVLNLEDADSGRFRRQVFHRLGQGFGGVLPRQGGQRGKGGHGTVLPGVGAAIARAGHQRQAPGLVTRRDGPRR